MKRVGKLMEEVENIHRQLDTRARARTHTHGQVLQVMRRVGKPVESGSASPEVPLPFPHSSGPSSDAEGGQAGRGGSCDAARRGVRPTLRCV